MKNIFLTLTLLATLSCCKSDDDNNDTLPPATQSGENTAGCLVDGDVLIPKGNGNNFQCYYQFVNGDYYFSISFYDTTGEFSKYCNVFSRRAEIAEGNTYTLNISDEQDTSGYGGEHNIGITEPFSYDTNATTTGELTITKLDFTNNIVSGTFWFDAINSSGEIKQIRDGRFDAQFTQ